MIYRFSHLPYLLLFTCSGLICAMAIDEVAAQETYPQRRSKVIKFTPAEKSSEVYVAIMGEVAHPGTYHLDSTSLKLQSVVQKAGGLTADASATIRVIRHGRVSHKEVYSDRANSSLFSGDLLVVDSKQSVTNFSSNVETPRESTMIHASYEVHSSDSGVQIALLNIADYPIVLRLRPEEANATNIVERLGQPIELMSNTYVITPDTFPRSSSESAKRAIRLTGGSVMVFDRERVNRSRLPNTLPKPIESNIAYGAQSGLIGSPQGQSAELRNLGGKMAGTSPEPVDFSAQFRRRLEPESAQSLPPDLRQQISNGTRDAPPPVSSYRPRIANLPFTGVSRITNSSTTESQTDRTISEAIPIPDDSTDPASSIDTAPALSLEEPVSAAPAKAYSIAQVLIICVIVGALSATALLLRRFLERRSFDLQAIQQSIPINEPMIEDVPAPTAVVTEVPVKKSQLERLIKNELPITFEAVEFPAELVLQGRIAAKPILRVDGAQSILKQDGPHFVAKDREAKGGSLQEVIVELDSAEKQTTRRPHFIDALQQQTASKATAATVQAQLNVDELDARSNAPLAKALFQLEQGGRS